MLPILTPVQTLSHTLRSRGAVALPGAALARFLSTEMEKSWKRQAKTDQAAFKLIFSDLKKNLACLGLDRILG